MDNDYQQNISTDDKSTIPELAEKARLYPYYPIAHFNLLKAYQNTGDENFEAQANKTALFFPNKKWLYWQLEKNNTAGNSKETILYKVPGLGTQGEIANENASIEKNDAEESKFSRDSLTKISDHANQEIKSEDVIDFQPLYTVDYFASQGIKLGEEVPAGDKLGAQLKSFTEWLKSMKKVHSEKSAGSSEESEKIIQHIAEASNTNGNIVTEAMAEVLVKQGKIENAIEIYRKLSLTNPVKSAYFAAKIESLKPV